MALLATDAIVLHSFDYLESSRILRLVTREAGVRQLERTIGSVARKVALKIAQGEAESVSITAAEIVLACHVDESRDMSG